MLQKKKWRGSRWGKKKKERPNSFLNWCRFGRAGRRPIYMHSESGGSAGRVVDRPPLRILKQQVRQGGSSTDLLMILSKCPSSTLLTQVLSMWTKSDGGKHGFGREFVWSGSKWNEKYFYGNSSSTKALVAICTCACAQFGSGSYWNCWNGFRIARSSYTCEIWQDSSLYSRLQTCIGKSNERNLSQDAIAFLLNFWLELQALWHRFVPWAEEDTVRSFLGISKHFKWSVARIQRKNCL